MTVKEFVTDAIGSLDEPELREVADYVAFLRFRARARAVPRPDNQALAALYGEFAEEDRAMADEGIAEYQRGLLAEDAL
jgi:hypothetical protein